jgi:site-specific DNA-methyltransferase (adenine-specific)
VSPADVSAVSCVCADAREERGYLQALGDGRAALLHTDPPYCLLTRRRRGGDLRDRRAHKKIDREPVVRFETVRDYRHFTEQWLPVAARHLDPAARMVIWTNYLGKDPILSVARSLGFSHLWGEFVWAKRTTEREGNEQLLRVYEVALVLARTAPPAPLAGDGPVPWAVVAGYDDDGEAARAGDHPHHKPFGVLEPLLRLYSAPGDVVLDPFAGSGSIPAAALRLGRRPAALELVPEWAERVTARLRSAGTSAPTGAPPPR